MLLIEHDMDLVFSFAAHVGAGQRRGVHRGRWRDRPTARVKAAYLGEGRPNAPERAAQVARSRALKSGYGCCVEGGAGRGADGLEKLARPLAGCWAATAPARPRCSTRWWARRGATPAHRARRAGHPGAPVPRRAPGAGIGWVPQERNIFKSLTVEENLTAVARRGRGRARVTRCSRGCRSGAATSATSSPAASSRCSRWRARWCSTRSCCCSTSRSRPGAHHRRGAAALDRPRGARRGHVGHHRRAEPQADPADHAARRGARSRRGGERRQRGAARRPGIRWTSGWRWRALTPGCAEVRAAVGRIIATATHRVPAMKNCHLAFAARHPELREAAETCSRRAKACRASSGIGARDHPAAPRPCRVHLARGLASREAKLPPAYTSTPRWVHAELAKKLAQARTKLRRRPARELCRPLQRHCKG